MLKIGDRVRVIFPPTKCSSTYGIIVAGMKGIIKDFSNGYIGVEFDDDIGCSSGHWNGKDGHCVYMLNGSVEQIKEN